MTSGEDSTLEIGQRILVVVEKITPNKAIVRLPNHTTGVVRRKEVTWDDASPDLHKHLRKGQKRPAILIALPHTNPSGETKPAELSFRLADYDPWKTQECLSICHEGAIIDGIVKRVRQFGAYVDIEPIKGVEGYIPLREIPSSQTQDAQEILWPGDRVRAMVTEFSPKTYKLQLSIKKFLDQQRQQVKKASRSHDSSLAEHLRPSEALKLKQLLGDIASFSPPQPARITSVLVVDDHNTFKKSLVTSLKEWGYVAKGANSLKEASQILAEYTPDVIFLDLSLSDGSSLKWSEATKEKIPHCHIVILSGVDIPKETIREIQTAGLVLKHKPFGPEEAALYLHNLEKSPKYQESKDISSTSSPPSVSSQQTANTYDDSDLFNLLKEIALAAKATQAIIFAQAQDKPEEIQIVAQWSQKNQISLDSETAVTLWYSPVGDVLRERKKIYIANAIQKRKFAKYLREAIPFLSCVGYPLQSPLLNTPLALFLFSPEPNSFPTATIKQQHIHRLETFLDRWQIFRILRQSQEEMLRSYLRAGAIHDISNSLGAISFALERLISRVEDIQTLDLPPLAQDLNGEIYAIVKEIDTAFKQMEKTLRVFRSLGNENLETITDINAIVRRSIERYSALARHLNVDLHFFAGIHIPNTHIPPARLQQVVDNVLLNAIQWSAGRPIKRVVAKTFFQPHEALPLQITIEDTGAGIHATLQQSKIYELGFSQRQNGSGLGLFIAKALLDAIGGQIVVQESVIGVGTTFQIRLPLKEKA